MELGFPSKRDGWLVAVIWASCGVLVASATVLVARGGAGAGAHALVAAALHGACTGFLLWVLYGTGYTVEERRLRVRGGPFRWTIALDAIRSVTPTRNPLSSPACSLDRLRIAYADGGRECALMVSPADAAGFLAALAARCPALALEGDRLVPRG